MKQKERRHWNLTMALCLLFDFRQNIYSLGSSIFSCIKKKIVLTSMLLLFIISKIFYVKCPAQWLGTQLLYYNHLLLIMFLPVNAHDSTTKCMYMYI